MFLVIQTASSVLDYVIVFGSLIICGLIITSMTVLMFRFIKLRLQGMRLEKEYKRLLVEERDTIEMKNLRTTLKLSKLEHDGRQPV